MLRHLRRLRSLRGAWATWIALSPNRTRIYRSQSWENMRACKILPQPSIDPAGERLRRYLFPQVSPAIDLRPRCSLAGFFPPPRSAQYDGAIAEFEHSMLRMLLDGPIWHHAFITLPIVASCSGADGRAPPLPR